MKKEGQKERKGEGERERDKLTFMNFALDVF